MSYWKALATEKGANHKEATDIISTGDTRIRRSIELIDYSSKYGHLTIRSEFSEQHYSYTNNSITNFEIELLNNSPITFNLEEANIYQKIWFKIFPSPGKIIITNFIISSSNLKLSKALLSPIDFKDYKIFSIKLKKTNDAFVLNLSSNEEFITSKNAEKYIKLIEYLASRLVPANTIF